MKSLLIIILLFVFIAGIAVIVRVYFSNAKNSEPLESKTQLRIGESEFTVEIANTTEERRRGLSGRAALQPQNGMLFIFPEPGRHGIWMKEMFFPIDIAWLNSDKVVVTMKKNALPESYPELFYPDTPAVYVIELPAGTFDALGIERGDLAGFETN